MKKIISFGFMIAASMAAITVNAQTADEIINKSIDAIGGKEAVKKINSLYMEGTVEVMGNENPTTVTLLTGKGYKTESDFNGQKMVQCITDKGGWSINPMAGGGAVAMPEEQYKSAKNQLDPGGALFDYAAKGSTAELLGKDGNLYKIKLVTKEKDETTFFIDGATYLISKMTKKGNMMGQEIEINISFSDYKKTDAGYVIPYTINTDLGQFQVATTIKKVEVNKSVDPAVFVMPK